MVRTRSGGLHLYFAGTGQPCGRLPAHHLDFKAAGGYVLVPPSFVEADANGPAGAYELLDHRPGEGARLDWATVRRFLDPPLAAAAETGWLRRRHHRPCKWVASPQPGDRNHPLYWAAKQAALADALDAAAVERFVEAALRAGLARRTGGAAHHRQRGQEGGRPVTGEEIPERLEDIDRENAPEVLADAGTGRAKIETAAARRQSAPSGAIDAGRIPGTYVSSRPGGRHRESLRNSARHHRR